MKVDLAKLKLFIEVLETGSITAGASRCHLSLAAASNRLQELEGALGVRLFERGKSGVTPTDAGLELTKHARSVLQEMDKLRNQMTPFSRGVRGRVKLLANTAALSAYLPEPLARFLSLHPEIDVDVQEMWTGEILEALHRKKADVGILADTMDTSGLHSTPLADDTLVVVGHPDLMRPLSESPTFEECIEHAMVGLSEESALYTYLQVKAAAHGKAIHYRVRMRSFEGVLRMASLGVGVSVVSSLATQHLTVKHPGLEVRALRDAWAKRRLILCTHYAAGAAPGYMQPLIDYLMDAGQHD